VGGAAVYSQDKENEMCIAYVGISDGVAVPAPLDELTVAPSKEAATRIVLKEYHQFRRGARQQENTARILLAVLGVCAMN
jgi:hypothetical protein